MILGFLFLFILIGDVCSSGRELISNGKKYYVLDQIKPEDSECKGSQSLMDEEGNIYCFKKEIDGSNAQQFQWNYAECGRENMDTEARIIGGHLMEKNRFPWIVLIKIMEHGHDLGACSGSIISTRAILTAGHCVHEGRQYVLYTGSSYQSNRTSLVYHSVKNIVHPKYYANETYNYIKNDVAIFITDREIEYSENVGPICLPQKGMEIKPGTEILGVGFGANCSFSNILLKYNLIQTSMPTVNYTNLPPVEELHPILYSIFKEIMSFTDEVFFPNLTLKNESLKQDGGIGTIELVTTHMKDLLPIVQKITDKEDMNCFIHQYPEFIYRLISSSYQTKDDIMTMVSHINEVASSDRKGRFVKQTFARKDECPLDKLSDGMVCLKSSTDGGVCYGDSGGPTALYINQKYYIGALTTTGYPNKQTFPIMCQCFCPDEGPIYDGYTSTQYYLDWIMKQLDENNAQIP